MGNSPFSERGMNFIIPGLCPDPPLVGEAGKQHGLLPPEKGLPGRYCQGLPGCCASSVLSLDTAPTPG